MKELKKKRKGGRGKMKKRNCASVNVISAIVNNNNKCVNVKCARLVFPFLSNYL